MNIVDVEEVIREVTESWRHMDAPPPMAVRDIPDYCRQGFKHAKYLKFKWFALNNDDIVSYRC